MAHLQTWIPKNARCRGLHAANVVDFMQYAFLVCSVCYGPENGLLQDRTVASSKEWRRQIQAVDADVYSTLQQGIKGGFDEEKFGNRIGFGNLKRCVCCKTSPVHNDAAGPKFWLPGGDRHSLSHSVASYVIYHAHIAAEGSRTWEQCLRSLFGVSMIPSMRGCQLKTWL